MIRLLAGLAIGSAMTAALVLGPLSSASAEGGFQETTPSQTDFIIDISRLFHQSAFGPLQAAESAITDNETLRFYKVLMQEYGLNDPPDVDSSNITSLLPDVETINEAAIIVPLREAGKQIRDKDLARYYYTLLQSAGLDVRKDRGVGE